MKQVMFIILFFSIVLIACSTQAEETTQKEEVVEVSSWVDVPLQDVMTGDSFRISSFDEPVFVESFAVWCPRCTQQQEIMKRFLEDNPGVVSVALNTDPNEDERVVREHIMRHSFSGYYAVSPVGLTRELIDEFGNRIVAATSVPMILLCPSGEHHFLQNGVKDEDVLSEALELCEV